MKTINLATKLLRQGSGNFTKVVTEKVTTSPDWMEQPSDWGAHFFVGPDGVIEGLPDTHRGSLSKPYDDNTLVIGILPGTSDDKVDTFLKALEGKGKEKNTKGKEK